jgi:hypothetical protein
MVKNQTRIPQGARLNIHHRIPQLRSYLVHHSFLSYLPHLSRAEAPGGTTESRHSPSRCVAGRGPPLPCSHGRVRTSEVTGDAPLAPHGQGSDELTCSNNLFADLDGQGAMGSGLSLPIARGMSRRGSSPAALASTPHGQGRARDRRSPPARLRRPP